MLQYQRFLDEIQQAVCAPESADADLLRDAAAEYAEACEEANARLREVALLLRKGLRGEAIQEAEREPNLLDWVALLDFPELPNWRGLLQNWGMAAPPTLAMETAADLNEAYAEEEPLQPLLKNHRLLALARAPLAGRIVTLRRIRKLDPNNPAWFADLQELEKARLKQLAAEAERAVKQDDPPALRAAQKELNADGWLLPVPNDLRERVQRAWQEAESRRAALKQQAAARAARAELEKIEPQLNDAYAEFDVEAGRAARGQWQSCAEVAGLLPNDELAERAAPALEWLEEQDQLERARQRHAAALDALERGLEENASGEQLERLHHAAARHEEGVPPVLLTRYRERMAAFELTGRRKFRLLLVGLVCGLLLVAGGVAVVVRYGRHRAQVASSAQTLQSLVHEARLEEASQFYDELKADSPSVAAAAEVQKQKGLLDGALRDEQQRRAAFEQAMTRAEEAGPETPDRAALDLARERAETDAEQARLARFESQVASARRRRQKELDEAFLTRLKSFRARVARLESGAATPEELSDAALTQLLGEVRSLIDGNGLVSRSIHAQAKPLALRVETIRDHLRTRRMQAGGLAKITDAVGNPAQFRNALRAFAQEYPEAAVSAALLETADEAPLWEGMAAWNDFLADPRWRTLRALAPQDAKTLLARGQALLDQHGAPPPAEYFRARVDYLESLAGRDPAAQQRLLAQLTNLFKDPLVGGVWMIENKEGERYYLSEAPSLDANPDKLNVVTYLAGFDLSTKRTGIRASEVEYQGLSPQSKLAAQAREALAGLRPNDWERAFYGVAREMYAEDQLEPVLKLILLQKVLSVGSEGSRIFAEAFAGHVAHLKSEEIDFSAPWMLPGDEKADKARARARALLAALPSLEPAGRQAALALQEATAPPEKTYRWIGWLSRAEEGAWQCRRPRNDAAAGELAVVVREPGGEVKFHVVGRLRDGAASWRDDAGAARREGRPLYLKTK